MRDAIKVFIVQKIFLFGFVAKGKETAGSDINILIKFQIPTTYDMYMRLKLFLEDLLKRSVDLVTEDSLRPEIKQ
ncbi:MAG: nucleotidyltransferase domain-containing protein [Rhabdochlamydiaceae bacterium]|nr:nucleotidyltransferase domain-containing protein [Rhabdochlamydiaceae bacterium]